MQNLVVDLGNLDVAEAEISSSEAENGKGSCVKKSQASVSCNWCLVLQSAYLRMDSGCA